MKKSVLYVDDEIINLELFKINFEDDFNVITAESGEEGLQKLNSGEDIVVIISDLKMPGMNGLELISTIKKNEPYKICIMLTAYTETDVMMKAINEDLIYKYLLKPWKRNELLQIINGAFEKYEVLKAKN